MADYEFKVCLHTEKVKSSENDIPLDEYTFVLPSFYFTLNEYVSSKATINIPNSLLSCKGANTYQAWGIMGGIGSQETYLVIINNNVVNDINIALKSKALVQGSETQYSNAFSNVSWRVYMTAQIT